MRLFDSLFRPKYIGAYLADKAWRVVLYFVLFFILCLTPSFAEVSNIGDLSYSDEVVLFQQIYNDETSTIKIENNKLNTTDYKVYTNGSIAVAFNDKETKAELSIVFFEDYFIVEVISNNNYVEINKTMYSSLEDSSLDISKIQEKNFNEIYKLMDYINLGYDEYLKIAIPQQLSSNVLGLLIQFLIVFAVLMYSGSAFNPFLPRKIRANVAVYSMTWSFVSYIVGVFMGVSWLFYIGAIISFIFMGIACRNIIRIKKQQ